MKKVVKVKRYALSFRFPRDARDRERAIADMLRYDDAFFNPARPDEVFVVKYRVGRDAYGGDATTARWESFGVGVTDAGVVAEAMTDDWVTYCRVRDNLVRTTFSEWLSR